MSWFLPIDLPVQQTGVSGFRMLEVLKRERISGIDQTIIISMKEMERLKMIVRIKEGKITVIESTEFACRSHRSSGSVRSIHPYSRFD